MLQVFKNIKKFFYFVLFLYISFVTIYGIFKLSKYTIHFIESVIVN